MKGESWSPKTDRLEQGEAGVTEIISQAAEGSFLLPYLSIIKEQAQ